VVEQNTAEGEARTVFCGTRTAEQAVSSYRLLGEGFAFSYEIIF
jgi:hypothetical protein